MRKTKLCFCCQSKNIRLVENVNWMHWKFSIWMCASCGVYFRNPLPSKRALKHFYESLYKKRFGFVNAEKAFEVKNVRQELGRIRTIEKYVQKGRLLDVGASTCFFISEVVKRKKWEAYGLELTLAPVKRAKKMFPGIRIKQGDVQTLQFPNGYFDAITMHSVFEHLPDPKEALHSIHRLLKPGGFFIFSIPNMRSFEYWFYNLFLKKFPGFIPEHLFYYSPKSIRNILEKDKFTIVTVTSRHYSTLPFPGFRPLISIPTFLAKLFLEYTDIGGSLNLGNILYVYAQKTDTKNLND